MCETLNPDINLTLTLVQLSGAILWNSNKPPADPGSQSNLSNPSDLWPLPDPEELKRQVDARHLQKPVPNPVRPKITDNTRLSAAPDSVPDAPPSLHEHRERASEGEPTVQETPEEDGKVTAVFCWVFFFYHFLLLVCDLI